MIDQRFARRGNLLASSHQFGDQLRSGIPEFHADLSQTQYKLVKYLGDGTAFNDRAES